MPRSKLHKAARTYARQGCPVFPCIPNEKRPLIEHGFLQATVDLDQIDEWWTRWPDANIGFCPGRVNQGVVDADGKEGLAEWDLLRVLYDIPETRVVRTPRGGLHLYFAAENFPTTAGGSKRALGRKIDTRGTRGYVLLPPSVTEHGIYTVENDRPIAPAPEWIMKQLAPVAQPRKADANVKLDTPRNLDRVRHLLDVYVRRGHVAVEGQGGNHRTFATACEVLDAGLSIEGAYTALASHWNPSCVPPWEDSELRTIVENAARYQQNAPGSKAPISATEAFQAVAEATPHNVIYIRGDEIPSEPETWLWTNRFPSGSISLIAGLGDMGKTTAILDLCARITTGRKWPDGAANVKGNVLYLSGEDSPKKVLMPRFRAAKGDDKHFFLIQGIRTDDGKGRRTFSLQADLDNLSSAAKRIGNVRLVVFDPLSSYFGDVNTWQQSAVRAVLEPIVEWADATQIAVLGNAHLGKTRGGNANMRMLDSVAIPNVSRAVYMIGRDPDEPKRRLFIPTKGNNGPEMQGLSFRFVPKIVPATHGDRVVPTSCIEWSEDAVETTADDMLSAADGTRRPAKVDDNVVHAVRFLKDILANGPLPGAKVMQAGTSEGFKPNDLQRARRQLGIIETTGVDWTMQLPDEW